MRKILLPFILMALAGEAWCDPIGPVGPIPTLSPSIATEGISHPYFKFIDTQHPIVGAGFLVDVKNPDNTIGFTDVAIITHSVKDGTIIPSSWQSFIPPESWVPLQMGFGGSPIKTLVLGFGTSANLSPIIAANLLRWVDEQSSTFMQGLKLALSGSGQGSIRIGGAEAFSVTNEGHISSLAEDFSGRGFFGIMSNHARLDFGAAWNF